MIDIIFDIETMGLDPLNDRITAIGTKQGKKEIIFTHEDEKVMLDEFWDYLRGWKLNEIRLIGFNSYPFDVPFLLIRSLKHNVKVVDIRYKNLDLRRVMINGSYKKGTLEDYAILVGHYGKFKGMDGPVVAMLWKQGKTKELVKYLVQDLKMTYALYQRLEEIGLI